MSIFTVQGHRLLRDGVAVPFKQSPNGGKAIKPELLVIHYTGSSSYEGAVNWLANPQAKASAHLVIAEDGAVTQMMAFNKSTWHAGKSVFKGRANCNDFSIGIELVNAGLLGRSGPGGFIERLSKKPVVAGRVIIAKHKNGGGDEPWAAYDPRQYEVAVAISQAITRAYRIEEIAGHDEISPGRKTDPGPAFPMSNFESAVLGRK